MNTPPDVIVIGAGLHGCSAALHLALRGRRVLLIEKNTAGRHASGVNAGGVRRLGRHPAARSTIERKRLPAGRGIRHLPGSRSFLHKIFFYKVSPLAGA